MTKIIKKTLSFILVAALTLSAFSMTAAAAEHVHNYVETKALLPNYEYISDDFHRVLRTYTYRCSCGDTYTVQKSEGNVRHTAKAGSQVCLGTSPIDGRNMSVLYQYTCSICGHTYKVRETVRVASVEQTE